MGRLICGVTLNLILRLGSLSDSPRRADLLRREGLFMISLEPVPNLFLDA